MGIALDFNDYHRPASIQTGEAKLTLEWTDLFDLMHRDHSGRWFPNEGGVAERYLGLGSYRSPSRAFPHSYSKPLLTRKFAKWLIANHPDLAEKYHLHIDSTE